MNRLRQFLDSLPITSSNNNSSGGDNNTTGITTTTTPLLHQYTITTLLTPIAFYHLMAKEFKKTQVGLIVEAGGLIGR